VAKRRKTKKCPVCKIEVKADRLENHLAKVHPEAAGQPPQQQRTRASPGGLRSGHWVVIAVVATILVASVAVYAVMNRHTEEYQAPAAPSSAVVTNTVRIETNKGTIVAELYGKEAPKTVQNVISLASRNYYAGTIFHRVIANFVIQAGGFGPDLSPKDPGVQPLPLETSPKLKNTRGTLAMARTTDPNSATSQFYINLKDNTALDAGYQGQPGYAVFGKVTSGMDVVDAIGRVPTASQNGNDDVPTDPVVINALVVSGTQQPQ
jgi:cyclophilin family peptidyl-prolyl cis-trans isomerase